MTVTENRISLRCLGAILFALVAALSGCGASKDPESLVASAKAHIAKREFNAAILELRSALQAKPGFAEARFLLGTATAEVGDHATAEKEFRRANELGWGVEETAPRLAREMVRVGKFEETVKEFTNAQFKSASANAAVAVSIGDASLALRKFDQARTAYLSALTFVPNEPLAELGVASLKQIEGDADAALALVDAVLSGNPKLPEALFLKADMLRTQRKVEPAIDAYHAALAVKADEPNAQFHLFTLLSLAGRKEDAEKQFQAMQRMTGKHPLTNFVQAMMLYEKRQYLPARDAVMQTLKATPDYLPANVLAGLVQNALGAYAQAESHLLLVLDRQPGNAIARKGLISVYLRSHQISKALSHVPILLKVVPDNPEALTLAANVYLANDNQEKAVESLERAVALAPHSSKRIAQLGVAQVTSGDASHGFAALERASALEADQTAPDLLATLLRLRRGEYDQALAALDVAEKKLGPRAQTSYLRGGALWAKKDPLGARKSFERALELNPEFAPAAQRLASLDIAENNPSSALRRFDAILKKNPKNIDALIALAEVSEQTKQPRDNTKALLERAVAAEPAQVKPRLALIGFYGKSGDYRQALGAAQAAAAVLPESTEVLSLLGVLQLQAGEANSAVQTFSKVVTLNPTKEQHFLQLAGAQVAQRSWEGATQSARKALAIKPNLLQAKLILASAEMERGNAEEALKIAKDLQSQHPKLAAGYLLAGRAHVLGRRYDAAAAVYQEALKRERSADTVVKLSDALRRGGHKGSADKLAAEWLAEHPNDVLVLTHVADTALFQKDFVAAARYYKAIVDTKPDTASAWNNLAWVSAQLNDQEAVKYAEKAFALQPKHPGILDTLGWILAERGDTARAVELLKQAIDILPKAHDIRLHYAKVLIKSGNKVAAKQELETLSKLGEKFPAQAEVKSLMAKL